MIFHPKVGQRVRLHYRAAVRAITPFHGRTGTVRRVGGGPGPINAEILLDPASADVRVVVPRGNLVNALSGVSAVEGASP